MKRANKFIVPTNWVLMFSDMNIDVQTVLAHSKLPADLFARENTTLSPAEYFRLWKGIEQTTKGLDLPLLLAEHMTVEAFDPPIFASICSPNLNVALQRISHYKPLIGPLLVDIASNNKNTQVNISCYENGESIPGLLGLCELVFFTQLARLSTRSQIQPIHITMENLPENLDLYEHYFGCKMQQGNTLSIHFKAEDAKKPFLTSNALMWEFFEQKLNQKLADLDETASTVDRVRAVLIEAIPSGDCSIQTIANELAMSKRTLQRKLTSETENFQSVLQEVRSELADHYLKKSKLSLGEISFLLGFNEPNSFIRAYSGWKGVSPGSYREQCQQS